PNEISCAGAWPTLIRLANSHPGRPLRTNLALSIQQQVCEAAAKHLSKLRHSGVNAIAVVVLDTATADCLASVSISERAKDLDLTVCPRSTGSTLKPFIYAAAFEAGMCTPQTVLEDSPAAWAGYAPADYDHKFRGQLTAAEALADSRNIPAMRVLADLGVQHVIGVMEAAGFKTLARSSRNYGLPLAIGGANATPLELAQAYATLARGGLARNARLIESDSVPGDSPRCLDESACWQTLTAISGADRTAAVCPEAAKTFVAWKTGTSSGHRDAWCAATTRHRTAVVWMGNINDEGSAALVGQESAAPLALQLIAALDRTSNQPWPATPSRKEASPIQITRRSTEQLSILSPYPGEQFVLSDDLPSSRQRIMLRATASSFQARKIWWFIDGTPLGQCIASQPFGWSPIAGAHTVRAVDEAGRAASVQIFVR
ncbi:MAG TPA: penicillin-binding transpeptidase domain-containing protein, partial [Bryobacteraceae bacterium]|nr:penicillin-binding transpeptidase domain-containing protein [Bryobacteraceae bacterium]